jgi:hypothetical protein
MSRLQDKVAVVTGGGSGIGRAICLASQLHPGTVIELSDISGPKGWFFESVRQASIDWDGADPIRQL